MKIVFLAPELRDRRFDRQCRKIVGWLKKQGHVVTHGLSWRPTKLTGPSLAERQTLICELHQAVDEADLILVECSLSNLKIGRELSYALRTSKPIIALMDKDQPKKVKYKDPLLYLGNVYGCEYAEDNFNKSLVTALKRLKR